MGQWDKDHYDHIDYDHINFSLQVCEDLLNRWGSHSAFAAFQPVNEPWGNSDMTVLKDFYRKVRKMVQELAPQAYFVFHDAFQEDIWDDLFADDDIEKVALDHHYYQAWDQGKNTTDEFCDEYE